MLDNLLSLSVACSLLVLLSGCSPNDTNETTDAVPSSPPDSQGQAIAPDVDEEHASTSPGDAEAYGDAYWKRVRSEINSNNQGLICHPRFQEGAITALTVLSSASLTESDILAISQIPTLQQVHFEKCDSLTDESLSCLQGLHNLLILKIEGCSNFTGQGLQYISTEACLQQMEIIDCRLLTDSGLLHAQDHTQLEKLRISKCETITDAGLAFLGRFAKLEHLIISSMPLVTDAGLLAINELPCLKKLQILSCPQVHGECLSRTTDELGLTELDLRNSRIFDEELKFLTRMPLLERLDLENCIDVTDLGSPHFSCLTRLQYLSLNGTSVTDESLIHIGNLAQLDCLRLDNTYVADAGIGYLQRLTQLRTLTLLYCSGFTNDGLKQLHGFTHLKLIRIGGTQTTSEGREAFLEAVPECSIY